MLKITLISKTIQQSSKLIISELKSILLQYILYVPQEKAFTQRASIHNAIISTSITTTTTTSYYTYCITLLHSKYVASSSGTDLL